MESGKRRVLSRIEIGTLAASAAAIAFGLAYAGPSPHMHGSLFGLAPSETVRLNVVNIESKVESKVETSASSNCMVQVKIFEADGSVAVQSEFVKILPGASFSHDIKYSDLKRPGTGISQTATDFTNRVQLRAATYVTDSQAVKGPSCIANGEKFIKFSLEVFDDQTGRTSFMVPVESFPPGQ